MVIRTRSFITAQLDGGAAVVSVAPFAEDASPTTTGRLRHPKGTG